MINKYKPNRVAPVVALLSTVACLPLLASTSAHAAPVWMEQFGSQGRNAPTSTATDSHDNIVVAGFVTNADGTGSVDTVKYDSAGHQLWSNTEAIDVNFISANIAVDANDNVTLLTQSYHFDDDGDYFGTTSLVHYSSAGKLYSNIDISNNTFYGVSLLNKIFASPNGDTTIVGNILANGEDDDNGSDIVAERFDSKGSVVYAKSYQPVAFGDNSPADAAIDPQGNLIVAGTGTSADPSSGFDQVTVLKYSPTGDLLATSIYQDAINTNSGTSANALILDPAGNAYVAAEQFYEGSNGGTVINGLLLRVKSGGGFMWARHYSVNGSQPVASLYAVTLDHSGNVVVAGSEQPNYFDDTNAQITLLKYSPTGHRLYTMHPAQLTKVGPDALFASSRTDDVYLVGASAMLNTTTYEEDSYTSVVSKIDPSGNAQVIEDYTGSPEDPNQFRLDQATFDPLLDTVYTVNDVDFNPGEAYDNRTATNWVTLKYRLGG